MRSKGQASFEYMTTIGVALIILLSLVAFAYYWTAASKESFGISAARDSVNSIVESANLVYAQGYPAKVTVIIQVPDNIEYTQIQDSHVVMRLNVKGGYTDISAGAKASLIGSLPNTTGYYKIAIQSLGDQVNVSQAD